jgi:hypothetical protein
MSNKCSCGKRIADGDFCRECLRDEFRLAVAEALDVSLDLYDEVCQAAAESDGDLGWLYDHVSGMLKTHRDFHPETWAHLPGRESIPGDAIWEAVESGVEWVRKANLEHPVVVAWEART